MKLTERIGVAGTALSWTEQVVLARRCTGMSLAGQFVGETRRGRHVRTAALDTADWNAGLANPVFRPVRVQRPIQQDKPRVPLCSRERCP
ncbi:hypothetical protein ACFS2C_13875 [Prauserella oleivorans]|uniref:Uncharacterized protein n=1 Tax=Prauserella oleivorans TaxID=1478153 RepID=A0ABW5WDN4_9PSEU